MFRCIQLNEEHDENPVIRKLLKLCHSHNVILQQNPSHNSQDLSTVIKQSLFIFRNKYLTGKWKKKIVHCITTITIHLVEKINLCYSVCIVPRVFNQKGNKTDKGIQCVETLGPDQGLIGWGCSCGLSHGPIAQVHTHLRAEAEEACYHIIVFQYTLLMHLSIRQKKISWLMQHKRQAFIFWIL